MSCLLLSSILFLYPSTLLFPYLNDDDVFRLFRLNHELLNHDASLDPPLGLQTQKIKRRKTINYTLNNYVLKMVYSIKTFCTAMRSPTHGYFENLSLHTEEDYKTLVSVVKQVRVKHLDIDCNLQNLALPTELTSLSIGPEVTHPVFHEWPAGLRRIEFYSNSSSTELDFRDVVFPKSLKSLLFMHFFNVRIRISRDCFKLCDQLRGIVIRSGLSDDLMDALPDRIESITITGDPFSIKDEDSLIAFRHSFSSIRFSDASFAGLLIHSVHLGPDYVIVVAKHAYYAGCPSPIMIRNRVKPKLVLKHVRIDSIVYGQGYDFDLEKQTITRY